MILFHFLDIENIIFTHTPSTYQTTNFFSLFRTANKLAKGKALFQKKPLGRRWYLISKPARSGICEFSTITSGTERKRGFAGIVPSLSRNNFQSNSPTILIFENTVLQLLISYLSLSLPQSANDWQPPLLSPQEH